MGQRWHFVGSFVGRSRQMTLARCHFAHRDNLIVNRWFDVGPTPVAQQALHMKQFGTVYQMISVHLKNLALVLLSYK